jgi:hypothetical protein
MVCAVQTPGLMMLQGMVKVSSDYKKEGRLED